MEINNPQTALHAKHGLIPDSRFEDLNMARTSFLNINMTHVRFDDINMMHAKFDDINMSQVDFHDINMSDSTFRGVNLGGAQFKHIGPAPREDGSQDRQKPIVFEEAMLCDSRFIRVDLSGVEINDCKIENMKIDGFLVADLIRFYKEKGDVRE